MNVFYTNFFYLSTDFQYFCCTYCLKFCQENISSTLQQLQNICEKPLSDSRTSKHVLISIPLENGTKEESSSGTPDQCCLTDEQILKICELGIKVSFILSHITRKPSSGFLTRSDKNQAVQSVQSVKKAKSLKFHI